MVLDALPRMALVAHTWIASPKYGTEMAAKNIAWYPKNDPSILWGGNFQYIVGNYGTNI